MRKWGLIWKFSIMKYFCNCRVHFWSTWSSWIPFTPEHHSHNWACLQQPYLHLVLLAQGLLWPQDPGRGRWHFDGVLYSALDCQGAIDLLAWKFGIGGASIIIHHIMLWSWLVLCLVKQPIISWEHTCLRKYILDHMGWPHWQYNKPSKFANPVEDGSAPYVMEISHMCEKRKCKVQINFIGSQIFIGTNCVSILCVN